MIYIILLMPIARNCIANKNIDVTLNHKLIDLNDDFPQLLSCKQSTPHFICY